jgi:RHS repeat-associated core domain
MSNVNRMVRNVIIALAVAAYAIAANAADLKFHSAPGRDPVVGRYLVTLDASVAADIAGASAEALARAYGGQLDLYTTSDVRQFAIAMLPARARTLSADPRVREVVEIAQPEADALAPPRPSAAAPTTAGLSRPLVPITRDSSSSGTYLYDGAGNIKFIGTDSFLYDVDGRLTVATVQLSQQSYTYDAFGNRTSATRATGAAGCVGGCEAAVTVLPQTNHLSGVTYDAAGNVQSGYGAAYTYDGTGMVTGATVGSDVRDFAYTAGDERIAVRQGVSWTWTVRDQGGKVLRELTSTETSSPFGLTNHYWSKDYVWRDGLLLASVFPNTPGTTSPTTTYHYHLDHLGTPRLVTDGNHIFVGKHTYYPFGAEMDLPPSEGTVELMKFTGHERDIVVGDNHSVDYMHARYYNGNLGRFLSVDPISASAKLNEPQSWNRYTYVSNNPLSAFDPDGAVEVRIAPPPAKTVARWTPEQRAAENLKNAQRFAAAERGEAVVTEVQGSSMLRSLWEDTFGPAPSGTHIDHILDRQLGGTNSVGNGQPLDPSVNTSNGVRTAKAIEGLPVGTRITSFQSTLLNVAGIAGVINMGVTIGLFSNQFEHANGRAPNFGEVARYLTTGDSRSDAQVIKDMLYLPPI